MTETDVDPAQRLFAEPGLRWQAVSPKLIFERRVPVAAVGLLGLVLVGFATGLGPGGPSWPLLVTGLVVLGAAVHSWFVVVPRMVRSWRYAERDLDLLVSHGRLHRVLSVVPYGRMQVIEVSANPLQQRLGLATVKFVTASASTDATIPGLPVDEAHSLRDRLAAKGEALSAGM